MKKRLFIKDNTENSISYYHLLLFMLSLPFDRTYSTVLLISFLLHTLIFLRKERWSLLHRNSIVLQSVFFVSTVSICYGSFPSLALAAVTKQLAILLFPVLLAVNPLDLKKYSANLLRIFALGCTCTVLYLYFDAFHIILYSKLPVGSLFSPAFVNHNFSAPIGMHATYLSMLLVTAFTWILKQLVDQRIHKNKAGLVACAVILLAGLVQLGSKSAFIALLLIMLIGFPWLVLNGKQKKPFIVATLSLALLLVLCIVSVDVFKTRYITTLENDLRENQDITDKSGRADRWNAALSLIKSHPFLGTGGGSEIPLLRNVYYERKMYAAYLESLNVHNQYLGFLINTGIAGLSVFVFTLAWALKKAIKRRDIHLFGFTMLVITVSFAEDILDVNKGIFFYGFFFSFFMLSGSRRKTNYIPTRRQPAAAINEYNGIQSRVPGNTSAV